ncbi:hypothetical protein LMG29542_07796 [Paraburkholderia humisilvae]|uniref:Uncharacterized protein n=1 Tax=Paraburkholderia humisilvae TaxID=627669 RepID=A0A6J5F6D3_9BURK|nr:hypothetical protein LMG29542_07796 [Paraburkholderia humisilvae]
MHNKLNHNGRNLGASSRGILVWVTTINFARVPYNRILYQNQSGTINGQFVTAYVQTF